MSDLSGMHSHSMSSTLEWAVLDWFFVLALTAAAGGFALAIRAARSRGEWPVRRTVFWYAGLASAGAGLLGPVATAAHISFTAHMVSHLLVGMLAPLLLVRAAPVTLALRALSASAARSLSRFLKTPAIRVLAHPVVAAILNIGGLWLLYTTDVYQLMHSSALISALVHAHIFLAGCLFTASLVGVDPNPHPTSMVLRSTVLIVFIAAHSILAKWLFANPPAGVPISAAEVGAQLMYYGGDVIDVTLIVLLFAGWYRSTRPRETVHGPRVRPGTTWLS